MDLNTKDAHAAKKNLSGGGDWAQVGGEFMGGGLTSEGGGETSSVLCPPPIPTRKENPVSFNGLVF